MNLEQIKKDLDNGVIISRETWKNLVIYAMDMEKKIAHNKTIQKLNILNDQINAHNVNWKSQEEIATEIRVKQMKFWGKQS